MHKSLYLVWMVLLSPPLWSQLPMASDLAGFYATDVLLELTADINADIRYTLDGSDPINASTLYETPILISDRSSAPNDISLIPTNPPSTVESQRWMAPEGNILKSTILKFALFVAEDRISEIIQEEYFVGEAIAEIQMPIVSVVTDREGLFDFENGIYVPGKDFADNPNVWQPGNYFNRGPEWERVAKLSYFENKELQLEQTVEIEIHGGGSRILPCKSLRLNAKNSLGAEYIDQPFFPTKDKSNFKRLILRNAGLDFSKKLCTDVLMHNLLRDHDIEIQEALPVVVFLNGAYWGIHNLREHYNKYYFEDYHNEATDEIDYFEIAMDYFVKEGSSADYEQMIDDLLTLDLSDDEKFATIAEEIDLDNYIDHQISKVYAGGTDWVGNNERIWRPQSNNAKWRWIANDYDDGFINIEKNSFGQATNEVGEAWPNPQWATRLFRALMTNKNFAKKYKSRLYELLETTFHPDNVTTKLKALIDIYTREIGRHSQRWNHPADADSWHDHIIDMKRFALERPNFLRGSFEEYFPNIYLNPEILTIYPNPIEEVLIVEVPENNVTQTIKIFDMRGALVGSMDLSMQSGNNIDVKHWPNGFYVVVLFNEQGEVERIQRVIKN